MSTAPIEVQRAFQRTVDLFTVKLAATMRQAQADFDVAMARLKKNLVVEAEDNHGCIVQSKGDRTVTVVR